MTDSIAICLISIICFALSQNIAGKMFASWKDADAKKVFTREVVHGKTRQITVPVLGGGEVKGYLLVQVGYTREKDADKASEPYIESVILDEALSYLFPKTQPGGGGVEKLDMQEVRKALLERIQSKIPDKKIVELRFQEFTFMNRPEGK